jgi:hypothetical protein
MTASAALNYSAYLGGASSAQVIAAMDAVAPPLPLLASLGLRLVSAAAAGVNPVIYTMVVGFNPVADATATATLKAPGASGSGVDSVALTLAGSGYVAPPIVSFTGGRPATVDSPGFPTTPIVESVITGSKNTPPSAQAYLKIVSTIVGLAGSGYSASPTAVVFGRIRQGGRQAKLNVTSAAGAINSVAIVDPGEGYTEVPRVTIVDDTGSGATITLSMGVGEILVFRSGDGFSSAPTVVLTPLFQALFPPGSDQAAPFRQLMTTALEQATMGPVSAAEPLVA